MLENKNEFAIEIRSLNKKFGKKNNPAVDNATFNVKAGSFHGFIGANGSGKTTTIKSIIGAYSSLKRSGEILIFGADNESLNAKKNVSYIPEKLNLPSLISAITFLRFMAFLSGVKWKDSTKAAEKVLNDVGMSEFSRKHIDKLSSGQTKKIMLAQALIVEPRLIIMDEPTANLDPQTKLDFLSTLNDLNKKGLTIFISSHELDELEQYLTDVTIIDKGQIKYSGATKSIMKTEEELFEITFDGDVSSKVVDYINKYGEISKTSANSIIFKFVTKDKGFDDFKSFLLKSKIDFNSIGKKKNTLLESYSKLIK